MEELSGVIDKVVFSNEENGYSVVLIKSGNDAFHVVGSFPSLQLGEILVCKGSWQVHPKYGRQFAAQRAEVSEPNDVVGIRRYLESGAIRGIGRVHTKLFCCNLFDQDLRIADMSILGQLL